MQTPDKAGSGGCLGNLASGPARQFGFGAKRAGAACRIQQLPQGTRKPLLPVFIFPAPAAGQTVDCCGVWELLVATTGPHFFPWFPGCPLGLGEGLSLGFLKILQPQGPGCIYQSCVESSLYWAPHPTQTQWGALLSPPPNLLRANYC